ncbi:MAG: protein-L-isoaspartate O-methyltransferase [Chloroflexi bacterium]|nr:protein-L-isoaspartate O-methyltransferase [Chloroflexota bacterium]
MAKAATCTKEDLLAELRDAGITDERVLQAIASVAREQFVPLDLRPRAWENCALPIGDDQSISQPSVVSNMVEAAGLAPSHRVLEIGTGSGYGAAILSQLAREVVTVEIRPILALEAAERLRNLRFDNVTVLQADGSLGWPARGPYDAILVTAAAPTIAARLLAQLSPDGGRLVAPIGSMRRQQLVLVERHGGTLRSRDLGGVRFVPLRGIAGFDPIEAERRN